MTNGKIVVIARTIEEGRDKYPSAAAIVTPRATDAADGIQADDVIVMHAMKDHPDVDELRGRIVMSRESMATHRQVETEIGTTSAPLGGDSE